MSYIDDLLLTIDDKPGITKEELLAISENPTQKTAIYSALARLESKLFVNQNNNGFNITKEGKKRLDYFLDILSEFKFENKRWWLLLIEIPEKKRLLREKLRYELKKIGVGTIKKGVYISFLYNTNLIGDIIRSLELTTQAHLIKIEELHLPSAQNIANQSWNWEELNNEYEKYIKRYRNFHIQAKHYSNDLRRIEAKKAVFTFTKILLRDPRLPDIMIKKNYLRPQALKVYEKIRPFCYS